MSRKNKRRIKASSIYSFAISWAVLAFLFPLQETWGFLLTFAISALVSYVTGKISSARARKKDKSDLSETSVPEEEKQATPLKSYGPEIDPIVQEGNKALSEMGRLYMSIDDVKIRGKINEIMRITDKIMQDAIHDPSDIPQIRKFFNYYLPTTIKLLNTYDRMGAQGIEGENLDKSMKSIDQMLDTAIEAYKKRLDSLFANQALDIETDIDVMNTMLAREGLSGGKDFEISLEKGN